MTRHRGRSTASDPPISPPEKNAGVRVTETNSAPTALPRLTTDNVDELIQKLRENVRRVEQGGKPSDDERLSSGCAALDRLLPSGGFGRGTLVEWLSAEAGSGAATLAMIAAREAARDGGAIVVFDARRTFYPPAAAALGIALEQLIVVRAGQDRDQLWALDQTLRCPAVAAVWAEVERLDSRWFRRWQLAAEMGGSLGLLSRSTRVRGCPSWADVQLVVQPLCSQGDRRWRIEVTRSRGGRSGGAVELELDEVTGALREVAGSDVENSIFAAISIASGRRVAREN